MEASETGAADAVALPALDGLRKPSGQKAEMRLLDTNTFADVLKHVDADTLLLLDIDETLLVSTCVLNSSAWWSYIFAKFEESALPDAKLFPLLKRLLMQRPHSLHILPHHQPPSWEDKVVEVARTVHIVRQAGRDR